MCKNAAFQAHPFPCRERNDSLLLSPGSVYKRYFFLIIVQLQTFIIVRVSLCCIMKALKGREAGFQGEGYNGAWCSGPAGSIALLTTTSCDHGQDPYPNIPPFVIC